MPFRYSAALTLAVLLLSAAPAHAQSLEVYMTASSEVVGPSERTTYSVTVANTGPIDLLGATLSIQLPDHIRAFPPPPGSVYSGCGQFCGAKETAIINLGTLPPGQSRTLFYDVHVVEGAPEDIMSSSATASAQNASDDVTSLDIQIDPTPAYRLSIAPDVGPVAPGEPFTYRVTFGNVGSASPSDVVLTMPVPEGTSFVSASDGGTLSDGVVSWNVGLLGAATSKEVQLTVLSGANLRDGDILTAEAELDPGVPTEYAVRSSAATPVRSGSPLHLAYAVSQTAAGAGDALTYTLTATNTGPVDLLDVGARVLLPGSITSFDPPPGFIYSGCEQFCGANEVGRWAIGTLAPGQSTETSFTTSVNGDAKLGTILRSIVLAGTSNTGSNQPLAQVDVLLGDPIIFNQAPSAAIIIAPSDGANYRVGGMDLNNPIAPDSAFTVTWSEATDPEGDALTYRWQLSTSAGFGALLVDTGSAEDGSATRYETDFGTLAGLLRDNGLAIGEALTLYHRVIASDGTSTTPSVAASITLTRGTIVSAEHEVGVPEAFALHGNYPNPFNPTTTFRFDLPRAADVSLVVYDALGRAVATVASGRLPAGTHARAWDASGLPSGVYLYRLRAGDHVEARKLVLTK